MPLLAAATALRSLHPLHKWPFLSVLRASAAVVCPGQPRVASELNTEQPRSGASLLRRTDWPYGPRAGDGASNAPPRTTGVPTQPRRASLWPGWSAAPIALPLALQRWGRVNPRSPRRATITAALHLARRSGVWRKPPAPIEVFDSTPGRVVPQARIRSPLAPPSWEPALNLWSSLFRRLRARSAARMAGLE